MKKIVIIGASGRLGAALMRSYGREFQVRGFNHAELDLAQADEVRRVLEPIEFDLLINCAALTGVDYCEEHREEAFLINDKTPGDLAEICRTKKAKLVHFSTDYVFDGKQTVPYKEEDKALPLSVYGESKLAGERRVLEMAEASLVVRVSWVFGPDRPSFIDTMIRQARESKEIAAVADKFSTPTYAIDVAQWLRLAWEKNAQGLLHLANEGECSWQEYAQYALDCARAIGISLKADHVKALQLREMSNFVARRPVYTVLSTARFAQMTGVQPRSWRDAVTAYLREDLA